MVTCKLYGRLGNQMFQIAATIGYAEKYGMPYSIPKQSISPKIWPRYFDQFPNGSYDFPLYKEPSHEYNDIPFLPNVCLDGYFQSEKYFEHCAHAIEEAFDMSRIRLAKTVSMHVRRGDYVHLQTKHPLMSRKWYERAAAMFPGHRFFIFSDDPEWCTENLVFLKDQEATVIVGNTPLEDLELMSTCEHNIIANSSFSWWAAWLNRNKEKKVVTPHADDWFGRDNKHLSTKDLIPKQWIQLRATE